MMTDSNMPAVLQVAQECCDKQEEQSKEEAAYEEQGKRISCD
jgi:hypothetical protein